MDKKVCLDTDACIAIIKQQAPYEELLQKTFSQRTFTTTISIFELFLRKTNIYQIENFIMDLEILNFDSRAARKASEIQKELNAKGMQLELRDIFIASTAIVNNCSLVTLNKKHFSRIKDLELLNL